MERPALIGRAFFNMPISSFSIVSLIACELNSRNPATVLDVGCGSGFYGAVVRQYVDMGGGEKTKLEGIEPFVDYKNANWRHYNMVWVRPIRAHLEDYARSSLYDCILFLDVIEHMSRAEGFEILIKLIEHLTPGGILLVSTPGEWVPQKAEYGNELEIHRAFYELLDFMRMGFVILKDGHIKDQFNQKMTVAKFTNSVLHNERE